MPYLLTIVGCKNAGKTRTCELLVPLLRGLGLRVGTLKYTEHEGFDWDEEGKDTHRHRQAGSEITGIIGRRVFAYQSHRPDDPGIDLDTVIRTLYTGVDLLLIEGLRRAAGLKLEVHRPGFTDAPVAAPTELLATYGASLFRYDLLHFDYGHEAELAAHIFGNLNHLHEVK